MQKPLDIAFVGDLVCDALFAEPMEREEGGHPLLIHLFKLDR